MNISLSKTDLLWCYTLFLKEPVDLQKILEQGLEVWETVTHFSC